MPVAFHSLKGGPPSRRAMPRSRTPPIPRKGEPPEGFRVARALELGRHPLLTVFPGLDRLPSAERQEPDPARRARLHRETVVDLVAEDLWMYVAPWAPIVSRRGPRPTVSPGTDAIVIGASHLRESAPLILFLDIFHELCHVRQRHAGAELFPPNLGYVERPTEIEAYRFVVEEARRLEVDDATLQEYLMVEWISDAEYRQLLSACGVPAPGPK